MKKLALGLMFWTILLAQNHPNEVAIDRIHARWDGLYPIRFAVVGDNYSVNRIFLAIMNQIHQIQDSLDFVLMVGDLTAGGDSAGYANYLAVIDTFDVPIISIMGNHELNAEGGWDRFIEYFGYPDFYFDVGVARFACLTDCYPADSAVSGSENVYYKFLPEQLEWLEDILDSWDGFKFVSMHAPPYLAGHYIISTVGGIGSAPGYDESLTEQFTNLVRDQGVYACFMGHFHTYDRWTPHNEQYGDVTYIISGGAGATIVPAWPYGPPYGGGIYHFMIMELYEDGTLVGHVVRPDTIDDGVVEIEYDSLYEFTLKPPSIILAEKPNKIECSIKAYPNPFNKSLFISTKNINRLRIVDITGKLIKEIKFTGSHANYTLSPGELNLTSGIYFLQGDSITRKVLYLP